jgi:ribosome maturation factor RimP
MDGLSSVENPVGTLPTAERLQLAALRAAAEPPFAAGASSGTRRGEGLGGATVYRDIPESTRALIEPIVAAHGLELVDIEQHRGPAPWRVRVIVDTPAGDGRVSIERCADVSREIGVHLDAEDLIPVRYSLEVSSPGFDRVLAREKDFARVLGAQVKVETRTPIDGRRRFSGTLLAFEAGEARLAVDGRELSIPFAAIARAHKVHQFTRADFSGAA